MNGERPQDPEGGAGEVTALLAAWAQGDATAAERLLPLVYGELRGIAARVFQRERAGHTLQPTALVHEAFLKLCRGGSSSFADRAHFYAVAARVMRQILVDHARGRAAAKRGGDVTRIELVGEMGGATGPAPVDLLVIDQALDRLAALDQAQAHLVELRFFGGLTIDETAEVLGVSIATVKRDWRLARAFLERELAS